MNGVDLIQDLFRHMEWADALEWSTVLAHPALLEDAFIRERLHHIHMVQRAFLWIWRGQDPPLDRGESLRGVDLARWGRAYHPEAALFLRALGESRLEEQVRFPWAARIAERLGAQATTPLLGQTLLQVVGHSTSHRGQVSARIRELGVEPPMTDFIAWAIAGKPQPAWPAGTA